MTPASSGSARRQALRRQRERAGIRIVPVPVTDRIVEVLLFINRLNVTDSEDATKIGEAIAEAIASVRIE